MASAVACGDDSNGNGSPTPDTGTGDIDPDGADPSDAASDADTSPVDDASGEPDSTPGADGGPDPDTSIDPDTTPDATPDADAGDDTTVEGDGGADTGLDAEPDADTGEEPGDGFLTDDDFDPMPGTLVLGPLSFEELELAEGEFVEQMPPGWSGMTLRGPAVPTLVVGPQTLDEDRAMGRHARNALVLALIRNAGGPTPGFNTRWTHETGIEVAGGEVYEVRALFGVPTTGPDAESFPGDFGFGLLSADRRQGDMWSFAEEIGFRRLSDEQVSDWQFQERSFRLRVPHALTGATLYPAFFARGNADGRLSIDFVRVSRVEEAEELAPIVVNGDFSQPWLDIDGFVEAPPAGWTSVRADQFLGVVRHASPTSIGESRYGQCVEFGSSIPGTGGRTTLRSTLAGALVPGHRYELRIVLLGRQDTAVSGTLTAFIEGSVARVVEITVDAADHSWLRSEPLTFTADFVADTSQEGPFEVRIDSSWTAAGSALTRWLVCNVDVTDLGPAL